MEKAVFGGGCFWCLEAVFMRIRGVESVISGYCGGHVVDPDYAAVCRGTTGHAEVVQVSFDPAEVDYSALLDIFFAVHDPTTLNRQGNDVGTQYRSVIIAQSADQWRLAEDAIRRQQDRWSVPVVTELRLAEAFYPAEDEHQGYFENHADRPYCAYVVAPKLTKAGEKFSALLKPEFR